MGILSAALIAFAVIAGSAQAQYQNRTLRLSFGVGSDNPAQAGFDALAACTKAQSGDKMKFRIFYDNALGNELSVTQSVRTGSVDMVLPSVAPVAGILPSLAVFDLPFLFNSPEEADQVLDGPVGDWLLAQLPAVGLKGLAWWENGFRNATNSKHAISSLNEFSGLKMRVMQNPIALDTFKTLGTNATPMAFSEVYSALETRTIDGQENPLAIIKAAKLYEVQKHLTLSKHTYTPYVLLVSNKLWESFSDDERNTLQQCALDARISQRQANRVSEAKTLEFLRTEGGLQVSEIASTDMQQIREHTQVVHQRAAATVGQEVIDRINAALQKIRSQ